MTSNSTTKHVKKPAAVFDSAVSFACHVKKSGQTCCRFFIFLVNLLANFCNHHPNCTNYNDLAGDCQGKNAKMDKMKKFAKRIWIVNLLLIALYLYLPFPIIHFVDKLPQSLTDRLETREGRVTIGTYEYRTNTIHVVKGYRDKLVLLHELAHWQIHKLMLPDDVHKWFDEHLTVR